MRSRVIDAQESPDPRINNSGSNGRNGTHQHPVQTPPYLPQNSVPYPAYRPPVRTPSPAGQPSTQAPAKPSAAAPAEGWLALLFLGIALYCVVGSIMAAKWVEQSSLLLWPPVVGLLVGLCIAKIPRFPQSILHLAACLAGHWLAVWLTSALAFHVSWTQVLDYLRAALEGRMGSMDVQASQSVFFFYLAFLCFFLGYFGSWLIYRARLPWLVALVYCSIILVNLNYVKELTISLPLVVVMVGALLLLIARLNLVAQIGSWRLEGLYTDQSWTRSITARCMQIACVITLGTLLFAWALPVFQQPDSGRSFWDRTTVVWDNLLNGRFSLEDLKSLSPFAPSQSYFSDRLTISGSVMLPQGEVLSYQASDGTATSTNPHYLEGFTFNHFDGHTWTSSANAASAFETEQSLVPGQAATGKIKVNLIQPPEGVRNYVFGPDRPASFSMPIVAYSDAVMAAWTTTSALQKGDSYNVSFVAPPPPGDDVKKLPLPIGSAFFWQNDRLYNQLRGEEYLAVPNDLSGEVQRTLNEWIKGKNSAYEAMQAIENHLSNSGEFTYSLENPTIPTNTDVVDWLLKNKRGFCTHYATAMAVMGRLLGSPTRMVNGFSQGRYDEQRQSWVVEGTDAHSWVQAYFPGYGWVNFDPTPGFARNAEPTPDQTVAPQPSPTSQPGATVVPTTQPTKSPTTQKPDQQQTAGNDGGQNGNPGLWMGIAFGSVLLALFFCLAGILRYWWRHLYTNSTFVSGLYWRFCKIASLVGLAPQSWQTPYEYSSKLGQRFPGQARSLWQLTELFVRDRWGGPQHLPHEHELADAEQHWHLLHGLFWRSLVNRIRRKS
jgi:transglutaminase-like putative cysteine protease